MIANAVEEPSTNPAYVLQARLTRSLSWNAPKGTTLRCLKEIPFDGDLVVIRQNGQLHAGFWIYTGRKTGRFVTAKTDDKITLGKQEVFYVESYNRPARKRTPRQLERMIKRS